MVGCRTYLLRRGSGRRKLDTGVIGIEVDVEGIPVVICEGTSVASTALGDRSRMAKLGYDYAFIFLK
jgi:hypothetical protein